MSNLKKKIDKKVNFEFNKEFIKVVTSKISDNDAEFITKNWDQIFLDLCQSRIWFPGNFQRYNSDCDIPQYRYFHHL